MTYNIYPYCCLQQCIGDLMLIARRNAQASSCWSLHAGAAPRSFMIRLSACKPEELCGC